MILLKATKVGSSQAAHHFPLYSGLHRLIRCLTNLRYLDHCQPKALRLLNGDIKPSSLTLWTTLLPSKEK